MSRLGTLVPVRGNLSAQAYKDVLANSVLSALWQQFGQSPSLYQHHSTSGHKAVQEWHDEIGGEELEWPAHGSDLNCIITHLA